MGVVDFILNLAGLLIWLNWRSNRFDPLVKRMPATLMGTLRPAAPRKLRRWHMLAFIGALLFFRALIYWLIGTGTNWSGKLDLGVVVLWFSSAAGASGFWHMVAFSFLSFGLLLGIFHIWLVLLSILAGPMPVHGLVTIPLGRIDAWPRWAKVLLPGLATAILWWVLSWPLNHLGVLTPVSPAGRFQQSIILGLASYLLWQFPLGAILVLHLLNSYIYFGKHSFWKYIAATANTILRPLKRLPLRIGRIDFTPLIGIILVFLVAHCVLYGIKTPEHMEHGRKTSLINIPGLVDIYRQLPF